MIFLTTRGLGRGNLTTNGLGRGIGSGVVAIARRTRKFIRNIGSLMSH